MSFETTAKDILGQVRDFHHQLSTLYGSLSKKVEKECLKVLLNYLGSHEKHLEESMANYEGEVSRKILDAWFLFPSSKKLLGTNCDVEIENEKNLTVDEVIQLALKLNGCLIDLYSKVIESSVLEEVRDILKTSWRLKKRRIGISPAFIGIRGALYK
jgi:hypothetical protein